MAATIQIPSADEQLILACNKRARRGAHQALDADQKFACVVLSLAPGVTQANYPALKSAVEAITGIQKVNLLVDGKIPANIPEGKQANLHVDGHIRIENPVVE